MAHYVELANRIAKLRPVITSAGEEALELFDEFLRENELDLALHVACDYLVESPFNRISPSILNEIHNLHEILGQKDECIKNLEAKLI